MAIGETTLAVDQLAHARILAGSRALAAHPPRSQSV